MIPPPITLCVRQDITLKKKIVGYLKNGDRLALKP